MTEEERKKDRLQQLRRDEECVKRQLLKDEKYSYLKEFYANNFDEIAEILSVQNSRLAIEDIMALSPSAFFGGHYEFLFMKQINDAIKSGVIKAEDFG